MTGGYRPFDGDAWLGRELPLVDGPYRILPESAFVVAEQMAFARQGRKARVFKLLGPDGQRYALKTFYRSFSLPQYVPITESLRAFADIRGLRACQRRLVSEDEAEAIGEPGLTYAVLMPWVEGVSWAGVVEQRFPVADEICVEIAAQIAGLLAQMEARQLAHADISSSNVLVTGSERGPVVELIDVEDMYHETFDSLPYVPDGSLGYAHPGNHGRGCRNSYGDRFAGAILLTELLVWHDPAIRRSAADISVFDQVELCRGGRKYDVARKVVRARSAEVATLFERAWDSPGPAGCPRLADWAAAMATVSPLPGAPGGSPAGGSGKHPSAACPGCGRAVTSRPATAHHTSTCALRPLSAPARVPGTSSFPGVPRYDDIGFIPLFGDENP